jgi:hypothetical protein
VPNSRVATYKQSYTTRYRTIRRISLRCEAGAHHVETDPLKTASLLHGNKVSKPIEIENENEIEIEIEMQRAGVMRCGRTKETVTVQCQYRYSQNIRMVSHGGSKFNVDIGS